MKNSILIILVTLLLISCKAIPKINGDEIASKVNASGWNLSSNFEATTKNGKSDNLILELRGLDFSNNETSESYLNLVMFFFCQNLGLDNIDNFDQFIVRIKGSRAEYFKTFSKIKMKSFKMALILTSDAIDNKSDFPFYTRKDSTRFEVYNQLLELRLKNGELKNRLINSFSIDLDSVSNEYKTVFKFNEVVGADTISYKINYLGMNPESVQLEILN